MIQQLSADTRRHTEITEGQTNTNLPSEISSIGSTLHSVRFPEQKLPLASGLPRAITPTLPLLAPDSVLCLVRVVVITLEAPIATLRRLKGKGKQSI